MKRVDYAYDSSNLRQLMRNNNLTFKMLSDITGISIKMLLNYTNGKTKPGFYHLIILADYFAVPVDYLMGRTDVLTTRKVLEDDYFGQLRRFSYEKYLFERKETKAKNKTLATEKDYEAPWPYNLIEDITLKPVTEVLSEEQEFSFFKALEKALDYRTRNFIFLHYKNGLNFREISEKFGLSREGVRQIIKKGIYRLRYPAIRNLIGL